MPSTLKIEALLHNVESRRYFLPEFQRGYVWTPDKVRGYFESLYRGYPTGSFLIWETATPSKLRGDSSSKANTKELILDGQQRITTLYALIRGNLPPWFEGKKPRLDLHFNIESEEFQYYSRSRMDGRPEWVHFPAFMKMGSSTYLESQSAEFKTYLVSKLSKLMHLEQILKYEYYLTEITQQDTDEVVRIFNLVNSEGTPLSQADLALALVTSRWENCKEEMRRVIDKFQKLDFDFDMNFLMRCISVIATSRGKFDDVDKLTEEDVHQTWTSVERALDYLVQFMIHNAYIDTTKFLSTNTAFLPILYYLSRNDFHFGDKATRDKFLYWFYSALLWGRYSGSSEAALETDVRELKETNSVDELIRVLRLYRGGNLEVAPEDLELQGTRSRFYQMLYIVVRSNGAADWFDPDVPLYSKLLGKHHAVQKHHIFPKSRLYDGLFKSDNRYDRGLVNEIANIALLSARTNNSVSDELPEKYLPGVDDEQLRSQFVPTDETLWRLSREGYIAFLTKRRELLANAINQLLRELFQGKSDVHVSRDVALWRSKVENLESSLRELIVFTYIENEEDIDWHYIPTHVMPKLQGRIKTFLRDHPGEEKDRYDELDHLVDFFDLSEYCDLFVSKDNWRYFESLFGNKQILQERFGKLQGLRNSLAHNRELSDIVIKDGEAALVWFSSILGKTQEGTLEDY